MPARLLLLFLCFCPCLLRGQSDCPPALDTLNRQQLRRMALISTGVYAGAQAGLYTIWYKQQATQSFRFFDDSREWQQMDKAGHAYTAFHLSRLSTRALRSTGLSSRKSILYGSAAGFMYMLPIEIMDGFSEAYGASWSDLAANAAGALFSGAQLLTWHHIRIHPKFSFRRTPLAPLRPHLLGDTWYKEIIKDYNGQTYWWSADLHRFCRPGTRFPRWLNLAFGYGAYHMVHASPDANEANGFTPYRQYYLALDLDLSYYKKPPTTFGNRVWNTFIEASRLVHLPAPALRFQEGKGLSFLPLFF